jgi:hypothetical protein
MGWAEHVASMVETRGIYMVLVWKPEAKRLLGRPRHRWEDDIKMDLQEVKCGGMDCIKLPQDWGRWCICECSNELLGSIKRTNIYTSIQTVSNISSMQNNLNADKSNMSANTNG